MAKKIVTSAWIENAETAAGPAAPEGYRLKVKIDGTSLDQGADQTVMLIIGTKDYEVVDNRAAIIIELENGEASADFILTPRRPGNLNVDVIYCRQWLDKVPVVINAL
jgi:hypothetical protein